MNKNMRKASKAKVAFKEAFMQSTCIEEVQRLYKALSKSEILEVVDELSRESDARVARMDAVGVDRRGYIVLRSTIAASDVLLTIDELIKHGATIENCDMRCNAPDFTIFFKHANSSKLNKASFKKGKIIAIALNNEIIAG